MRSELAAPTALALRGISKTFGDERALDRVDFGVRAGSVHALLGENGAGKTTLMRIAFGLLEPNEGSVAIWGTPTAGNVRRAIAAGAGMVHQHFTNVPAMTVAENVALGGAGLFDARGAATEVEVLAARTSLAIDPRARVGDLPVGAQQRLEILKALSRGARLLILDEPTAVLAPAEVGELLRWLRAFADEGNAVVLITHKLREALAVADDVTVLRRGSVTLTGPASQTDADALAHAMLGEALPDAIVPGAAQPAGDVVVRATGLRIDDDRGTSAVRDAAFEVRRGEIVGVAAVEGSGQHELLLALAGRRAPSSGELALPEHVGFVPEDRHRDALALDFRLFENVAVRGAGSARGMISWRRVRDRTARLMDAFDVRGGTERAKAGELSGGNQQKLVMARELEGDPPLLVVDNPTRGLDIRATRAVHDRLREAAQRGAAVVVHSSDIDEVLSLATRMLVVHAGVVQPVPLDREAVGRAMLGAV